MPQLERNARIFVGPDPVERGWGHPGYRGKITLDGAWVHMKADEVEYLAINEDLGTHEWEPLEYDTTIPAAGIDQIAWSEDPDEF